MHFALILSASAVLVCSCGDNLNAPAVTDASARVDAAVADAVAIDAPSPDAGNPLMPTRLAETGLYSDFDNLVVSADVTEYVPQFELWSDGASKRRWVQIPAGAQINSSDMDFWSYPEGTKLWKEFSRGGLRVETRLYWKQGPQTSDWEPFTFVWNSAQDDAVSESFGLDDALGTGHDVPTIFDCGKCHGPQADSVLGYSAIQLDGAQGGHNLSDLVSGGTLTDNPPGAGPTFFPLPGAAVDRAALGYLHGNCGGCHFPGSEAFDVAPVVLRLVPGAMASVEETGTYISTVGVAPTLALPGATSIVEPGAPQTSALRLRMGTLVDERMPPVASAELDTAALIAIDDWINAVTPP